MTDSLIENGPERVNAPEYTVSELSGSVKVAIESAFGHVRVRGEVGRVSSPRSGHVYLDLKDDRAVLASVIWKGQRARLDIQPQEGDEVVATGRLTTFPGQSKYQLVIEQLAYAGTGALLARLERLRAALAAEGLFAAERKRPIPYLPRVIGVVTSPTGAVIRDILHRLAERFPVRVLVWPVAVQGAACAPEVAAAVRGFGALPAAGPVPRPDVLIVARGGGSVEDLWGFNEEAVVRAVVACPIPVISAVGHETDTTLIDLAADLRAPTPTAAAELAVPVRADLLAAVADLGARRHRAMARAGELRAQRLRDLARALPRPQTLVEARAQALDALAARLPRPEELLAPRRERLGFAAHRLPRALAGLAQARRLALGRIAGRLTPQALAGRLERLAERLGDRGARLGPGLARVVSREGDRLGDRGARLAPAFARAVAARRDRLAAQGRMLASLDPRQVLARGYALVRDGEGAVLTRAEGIVPGAALEIEFADGRLPATAGGGDAGPAPRPRARRSGRGRAPGQPSLFDGEGGGSGSG